MPAMPAEAEAPGEGDAADAAPWLEAPAEADCVLELPLHAASAAPVGSMAAARTAAAKRPDRPDITDTPLLAHRA